MPRSDSNSNPSPNPHNSENNSPSASPSPISYGSNLAVLRYSLANAQTRSQTVDQSLRQGGRRDRSSLSSRNEMTAFNGASRPSTPTYVYIVTSNFTSPTASDGVRLSESEIVGFQILAVFARLEDANSYAEHECEEIDAGVRRRRRNRIQGGPVGLQEGQGIRAEAIVRDDETVSWNVEDVGQIEVVKWVLQ